ncbi:type VI secretion system baseplate subunit TssK [Plasticicumulans acidivorans]|uniref:Type VI secretion system protein ImpJ n=1 Tax=Plasticicumulans acidivorans TaxID=886464 RepID=A0A317MYN2_9GAMM|nr:type VI secretion system baseplate subunit TssK [Plasticicumulans acidivorans]PWV64790.1 type VI secretion system protein ImpJ [Plasticicumulans acidivorans]
MTWNSKVVWSEGMFLRPQHFQQQERYLDRVLQQRAAALAAYGWGFTELALDRQALALGRIAILSARGLLPDGTPFFIPDDDVAPPPLLVPDELRDTLVVLALPLRRPGLRDTGRDGEDAAIARYRAEVNEVRDDNAGLESIAPLELARSNLRLLTTRQDLGEYACLGLCRVVEKKADQSVVLDERYIPPMLDALAQPLLAAMVREVEGLLHQRGEALAGRVVASGRGGAAEIADFLLLQVVNRLEPLFTHLARRSRLHPEDFYRELLGIAGELATFTRREKRPLEFPAYDHDDLSASFAPVIAEIRQALSMVLEQTAIPIPLQERGYGVHVGVLADRNLLGKASFVLAVHADVPNDILRARFPTQVKIGAVENIRDLVNRQLPGIALNPLPVAPRQIPYHAGVTYFELDPASELWKTLAASGGFAFHVAGQFPGLEMSFWAIRS